jgi:hypothetical protein
MHNARKRRAAAGRRAPVFPVEVVIPPHRGASLRSVELPPPAAKPPSRPDKSRAAPKRRKKQQRRRKVVVKTPSVIALPQRSEPLTEPAIDIAAWSALAPPQPTEPLPRSRALAVQRGGGLLDMLALWLGTRTLTLWRRLGQLELPRVGRSDTELLRLRAENERLRLQLEALLVLQSSAVVRSPFPQT